MITLDRRTRTGADLRTVDVKDFFERELPALIAERGGRAIAGATEFGLDPVTIITDSGSWTLARTTNSFSVERGDGGLSAIKMSDSEFGRAVVDLTTFQMQKHLGKAEVRGDFDQIEGWWTALRSLLDDRPFTTAGSIQLRDRDGKPLDLTRTFTPEDDDAEIAHFLCEAGFLHLRGWFNKDLMRQLSEDIDRGFAEPEKAGATWMVTLEDGTKRPTRIPHLDKISAAAKQLIESEAYLRLGRLTNEGFQHAIDVEAAERPLGVVSGMSHLPWHIDCSQGMHSYKCSNIVVGICVTDAGPGSAQLGVLPGSHRALMPMNKVYPHVGLEPAFLAVEAGDVTIHTSCTLHTSLPPTDHVRKVIYTGFSLPCDSKTEAALEVNHAEREQAGVEVEDIPA